MEVGELLDEAFDLYRRNFRLLLGVMVLLDLPITLLQIRFSNPATGFSWADGLAGMVAPVTFCALTVAAAERLMGREVTIVGTYRLALRHLGRLFLGVLVVLLAFLGAVMLLILPGALLTPVSPVAGGLVLALGIMVALLPSTFLMLWAMLVIPVIVMEGRGAGALSRARQLAQGNLWRLFFVHLGLMLVVLLYMLVLGALAALAYSVTRVNPLLPPDRGDPQEVVVYSAMLLLDAVLQYSWLPVATNAMLLAYLDLRVRREALDLDLLASGVEARIAARSSPANREAAAGEPYPGAAGTADL